MQLNFQVFHPISRKNVFWSACLLILFSALVFGPTTVFSKTVTIDVKHEEIYDENQCLECHDSFSAEEFADSSHGSNSCTSCHVDIIDIEKHAEGIHRPRTVDCGICHERIAAEYEASYHKLHQDMDCSACHSDIHTAGNWNRDKTKIIEKCTVCHENDEYVASGHDAAVLRGNTDSAVCSDCHGLHNTRRLHTDLGRYPEEARIFYTETCVRCHGDKEMMKRNNLSTNVVETYAHTYHGKIQKLGYATHVAGCADCHTYHNILPKSDPKSAIHTDNLVKNCGKCHPKANANFVTYEAHADFHDRKESPVLFWTVVTMTTLLVVVFVFFWVHTLLWWRKTYWANQRLRSQGYIIDPHVAKIENPGEYYTRFPVSHRFMHFILIISFFGLVLSGIPLKFSGAPWAQAVVGFLGGASAAGFIHRFMAGILIILFLIACVYCVIFLFDKKNGETFWKRLFGPDSLCPRIKDWHDFMGMGRWFVGMGPMPKFDRWTYWEKFDFIAVFWGMFAIGLSGIILWAPDVTARILPGWIFNIAIIIHSDEAMLAAGFIFTVHFFNTHFIPSKFPMDTVIFTGKFQKYKFLEEKPLHYDRLEKEGRLDKFKTEGPDIITNLFSSGIGLIFIALGMVMLVFIFVGLFFSSH